MTARRLWGAFGVDEKVLALHRWWLHSTVNVLNVTELCTENG